MAVAWGFGLVWAVCWFGGCTLSGMADHRIDASFSWERGIPFMPEAIPIYLSMDLLMLALPLAFRSGRDLLPLAMTMAIQSVIAGISFVIFPLQTGFATRPLGIWGEVFGAVSLPNLAANGYAPSLHVAFSLIVADCLGRRWGGHWRWITLTWAALVAVSTVLVHEHLVIDALSGAALGLVSMPLLRWLESRTQSGHFPAGASHPPPSH